MAKVSQTQRKKAEALSENAGQKVPAAREEDSVKKLKPQKI